MRGDVHAVLGAAAGAVVAAHVSDPAAQALLVGLGALGALLPDIDSPRSTLGRLAPWPAARSGALAHRGIAHSIGAAALAAAGAWWAWGPWPALAIAAAYASHLLADLPGLPYLWWPL